MNQPGAMPAPIDLARYAREFPSLQFLASEPGILELSWRTRAA